MAQGNTGYAASMAGVDVVKWQAVAAWRKAKQAYVASIAGFDAVKWQAATN